MAKKIFGIKTPKPAPVVTMPLPDDEAIQQAKKRALLKNMSRTGRASTILSDSESTLGG